jgi:hypothetical protein
LLKRNLNPLYVNCCGVGLNAFNQATLKEFEHGYIVGLFLGDGYWNYNPKDRHYRAEVHLNSKNDKDIKKYINKLLNKGGLKTFELQDKRGNSVKLYTHSKAFFKHLQKNLENIQILEKTSLEHQKGVLSGFIDAEGYVKKGEIVITQKDPKRIEMVQKICQNNGFAIKKVWQFKNSKTPNSIWRIRLSPKNRFLGLKSIKIARQYTGDYLPNHSE